MIMTTTDTYTDPIVFLHGDLEVTIAEAQCLPNMDILTQRVRRCLNAFDPSTPPERIMRKATPRRRKFVTCNPYATVCLAGATVARTRVIPNSQNPVWDEHFVAPVAHPVSQVEIQVKDNDVQLLLKIHVFFGCVFIKTVYQP
ncbi:putative phospholipase D [Helianthus anomalus]